MPSKSMSPMPMQSKIGEASLKFGPDWLRALSSDSSTSSPPSPWSGGSGGGGGTAPSHASANNTSTGGGGNGFGVNHHSSSGSSYQHHSTHTSSSGYSSSRSYSSSFGASNSNSSGGGSSASNTSTSSSSSTEKPSRYKTPKHKYCREEMLSLYDKNFQPPEFLPAFGTLFIEKTQTPLAFSQASEEESRIWHIPQPQSSRQPNDVSGPPAVGRGGYSIRGRGSGIERGRGRGRGGYYGRPPYDEEDRVSFSRPRTFDRSVSAHERNWSERNGTGQVGASPPEDGGSRGGGNWRNRERESFGTKRSEEDDGWRRPRWRRDDEEEGTRSSSSRRLHKSWSEDGTHDNLPEWAKDGNDEREGGTFDASGAFHEEDGYSAKTDAFEKSRREAAERERSKSESEPHGSQNDRVQKRTPDRITSKSVIPPSVKEEAEESGDIGGKTVDSPLKLPSELEKEASPRIDSLSNIQSNSDGNKIEEKKKAIEQLSNLSQKLIENNDARIKSSQQGRPLMEDEHFLSMTKEADSLVAKLIEEEGSAGLIRNIEESTALNSSIPRSLPINLGPSSSSTIIPNHSVIGPNTAMNPAAGLDRTSPANISQTPPTQALIEAMEIWFYRDPQGNVQGPFSSHEMHQWYLQGYFTGGLLLRRECDKIFITLHEMGKLYDRNPFDPYDADYPPPAPILEPSALDPHSDGILHAQYHQRQQQILQQQNLIREQKYLLSMNQNQNVLRAEPDRWHSSQGQQPQSNILGQATPELTSSQMQAQMILNIVKNAGANIDPSNPNPIEHLQALFNRQAQMKGVEPPTKAEFMNSLIQSQMNAQMDQRKSPTSAPSDPIQSLIQQLNSMSARNMQPQMQKPVIPKTDIGTWGSSQPMGTAPQMQTTGIPWGHIPQQQQQPANQNSSVWDYRDQVHMKIQQQKIDEELSRRKKQEEEKERMRLLEEEEQRRRLEEQKRLELEEQERRKAAILEEQFLMKKKQEEMLKQQAVELERRRREEEKLEEEKRKAAIILQEMQKKQQEEMQAAIQRAEMERQRQLERQRQEQKRIEQQRLEQQLREQQEREEQQRKLQQEQEELQRQREREQREEQHRRDQEEMQRREREELKRREQQSKFSWNPIPAGNSTLPILQPRTLLEIQQEEAVKQQEEIVRQQVLKKKQLEQQQEQQRLQQQNSNFKWAQAVQPSKPQIKSFAEIQAEEAAKLAKQQEKEREHRATIQQQHQQQQVWSSSMSWAAKASLNAPPTSNKSNGGSAWDDSQLSSSKSFASSASGGGLVHSASNKSQFPPVSQQQSQNQRRPGKETDDNFMKLFHEHGLKHTTQNQQSQPQPQDEFTRWCYSAVEAIGNNVDIPVFISFLKEVESPYEVNDYVRSYLGDGREAREFAKDFLERRSRWRNANKGGFEDNLCRPASAINPTNSDFQEVKIKGKIGKKGKMQKVDSKNLGFTTSASNKRGDYGGDSTD